MNTTHTPYDLKQDLLDQYSDGLLDDAYAEYIMANALPHERLIYNGDTLLDAMEAGYLLDDFIDHMMHAIGSADDRPLRHQ